MADSTVRKHSLICCVHLIVLSSVFRLIVSWTCFFVLFCLFIPSKKQKTIGCDGIVGSEKRPDACGVCGGSNSTCQIVSGIFTEPQLPPGYNLVAQLPKGACHVNITEFKPSRNYLGTNHFAYYFKKKNFSPLPTLCVEQLVDGRRSFKNNNNNQK